MKSTGLAITAALTVLAMAPASASADDRRGSREQRTRAENRRADNNHDQGRAAPRAVPRSEAPRPSYNARDNRVYDHRGGRPVVVAPRVVRPYVVRPYGVRPYVVSPYYARPYVFRPRTRLNFGIYLGYPVPYSYAVPYPVPVYGYGAPVGPVVVGPNSTQYGGVSLEINPPDASVYVDGAYAGLVRDFDGTRQTLTLANGRHRIEIDAQGFEPWTFDVDIVPGQIVPYRGDLQPY